MHILFFMGHNLNGAPVLVSGRLEKLDVRDHCGDWRKAHFQRGPNH